MKTLKQLCKPRRNVFDSVNQDIVLNLLDLVQSSIDAEKFFAENYVTASMRRLWREAFKRLAGQSAQGIFSLRQAMGGGKTHNMLALGLLAQHSSLRERLMEGFSPFPQLGPIKVIVFSGRESDAPLGIWGALAEQLYRKEQFAPFYTPLQAPGETSWVNLLKGEPLLILLDELPAYFENASSIMVGNSDLARVTSTALSNLLTALGRTELNNVCLVISSLEGTYEEGSQQIDRLLNLKHEVERGAVSLEPIHLNTDEFYHILRKRLFEKLPEEREIANIAQGYAQALRDAKQMELIRLSPEQLVAQLQESYPFHFALKDLYARFRENSGFQQTRGLIRLMRTIVARIFDEQRGTADQQFLIHAHDIDLNDPDTVEEITRINDKFGNAITHDIANNNNAVAEQIDAERQSRDAQDVCKLILISSLANIPNPMLGLSLSEIVSFLCSPGRDVSQLPGEIIDPLLTYAWYLHTNTDGRHYFKDVKSLAAQLNSLTDNYSREVGLLELKEFLKTIFTPSIKDCYQDVLVFPALDSILNTPDKVTLVICEPYAGGLHPDLQKFFEDLQYQNRILFLSGTRANWEDLIKHAARLKAIRHILEELQAEQFSGNAALRVEAEAHHERIRFRFLAALREVFRLLLYPYDGRLLQASFSMTFVESTYKGELQIQEALGRSKKFIDIPSSDEFCVRCEARLFTQKEMYWTEIKKRAARETKWPWHPMNALDLLKNEQIRKGHWRENGPYVEKPPFPAPCTDVQIQVLHRDSETGTVRLRLHPLYGDTIHWSVHPDVNLQSPIVSNGQNFEMNTLQAWFLCSDSTEQYQLGEAKYWSNQIAIKKKISLQGNSKLIELQAVPNAPIFYTLDGSNPELYGQKYQAPFLISPPTPCILAVAKQDIVTSAQERIDVNWDKKKQFEINPSLPTKWRKQIEQQSTHEVYQFLACLKKYGASVFCPRVMIGGKYWVELTCDEALMLHANILEQIIEEMRLLPVEGTPTPTITLSINMLQLPVAQNLLDLAEELSLEIRAEEVQQ